jgi:cell division septation protein DedD
MKIDKDKLVDLLVEKTDMGKNDVEVQLEQLVERIVDAAKRGKALEIKEFGSFFFDEEGELKFDPSDELSTEISFKYAGMEPVVLKPERGTAVSPPAVINKETADDAGADAGITTGEGISAGSVLDDTSQKSEIDNKTSKKSPDEKEIVLKPKSHKKTPQPVHRKPNNAGIWIVAAIIFLALLAGGYFYFLDSPTGTQTADETEQTQATPEELPVITDEQIPENIETPPEFGSEQDPGDEVTDAEPESAGVQPEEQDVFGLMGSVMEEANNGYSIVLHSLNDEETARAEATSLSEQGYRALVSARTVAGNPVWRVSVGQFETLSDAQNAASELPTPYNTQNFIQRIQNN